MQSIMDCLLPGQSRHKAAQERTIIHNSPSFKISSFMVCKFTSAMIKPKSSASTVAGQDTPTSTLFINVLCRKSDEVRRVYKSIQPECIFRFIVAIIQQFLLLLKGLVKSSNALQPFYRVLHQNRKVHFPNRTTC